MKILFRLGCGFLLLAIASGVLMAQTPDGKWVVKLDPSLDQLVAPNAKLEPVKVDYFGRLEGPIWYREGDKGYLLFSEVAGNTIDKWEPTCAKYPCRADEGRLSIYEKNAGFRGKDISDVGVITYNGRLWIIHGGPIGLALDPQNRVLIAAFGDRAVERIEKDGSRTVVADHYDGMRLSCPNDIAVKSDGTIYFSDGPVACLRGGEKDPARELPYHALFMVKDEKVILLDKDNPGVNGVELSPDEKTLYVTGGRRSLLAYDVQADDTVTNRRLFIDESKEAQAEAGIQPSQGPTGQTSVPLGIPDGIRTDSKGNVWVGGPGGVWIISPQGKHLGTILAPNTPEGDQFTSHAFGDDGKTLYIVGGRDVYRIRVRVTGRMWK